LECFDKVLEIDAKYAFAWSNKGVSLLILCRYEEALRSFEKALEIDPNLETARKAKQMCLENLGRGG
jgi:tetratricopeptide (TPR) repeat protein